MVPKIQVVKVETMKKSPFKYGNQRETIIRLTILRLNSFCNNKADRFYHAVITKPTGCYNMTDNLVVYFVCYNKTDNLVLPVIIKPTKSVIIDLTDDITSCHVITSPTHCVVI